MNEMPSHGNASMAKTGNASMPAMREGFKMGSYAPGVAGGHYMQGSCGMPMPAKPCEGPCHFPAPPPKQCYCHPAAFTSLDGRSHQRLLDAYGSSRPCSSYY
jgi:hypothetical protein